MIEQLDQHYAVLRQKLGTIRALCRSSVPDIGQLSHARHDLMAVSMKRSRYLQHEVYPLLLRENLPGIAETIANLDRDLADRRGRVSRYLATWTLDQIRKDWTGYRDASARVARGVEDRVRLEEIALRPALKAVYSKVGG